jgi:ABC-type multidrug transport system ATPase subunit
MTTISISTTLLELTTGNAKVLDLDVVKAASDMRQPIGVTFQDG